MQLHYIGGFIINDTDNNSGFDNRLKILPSLPQNLFQFWTSNDTITKIGNIYFSNLLKKKILVL